MAGTPRRVVSANGELQCCLCGQWKWPIQFSPRGKGTEARKSECKECVSRRARIRWRLKRESPPPSQSPDALPAASVEQPDRHATGTACLVGLASSPDVPAPRTSVERPARRSERRGGSAIAPEASPHPRVAKVPLVDPPRPVAPPPITDADLELLRTELGWLQDGPVEPRINYRMQSHRWSDAKIRAALEMVRVRT